jgi:hypothetical protein
MKPHQLFDAQPADSTSPPRPRMSRTRNLVAGLQSETTCRPMITRHAGNRT